MASKKTKKKSSAKPAKKKSAKKAPAKKAAPKKAKAAAKKAAPKKAKAAAKKAAPKKKPAAKKAAAPKKPKETIEALIEERIEAIEVVDAADIAPVEAAPSGASLQDEILSMARQLYGNKSDAELLELDPNDIDAMDPSMFYELLGEKYGVAADPNNDYFGGFGGKIKNLIAFIESRWDGQTRKDTPMPPGEWLEEYVHPES